MDGAQQPAAGWYPTDNDTQRSWDGRQWTSHTSPARFDPHSAGGSSNDQAWILAAHLLPLVSGSFGVIGPLVVWLSKRDQSETVAFHAKEALNFQLTMMLVMWTVLISVLFVFNLIPEGILLLIPLWVLALGAPIMAAVKASQGKRFRYPLTIRFVK